MSNYRGLIVAVSGPSGVGKGTVLARVEELLEQAHPGSVGHSISVTTRAPRGTEKDGVEYYFRTTEQFEQMIKICGYRSNHSNTKTDRIVEPFMLMNNNNEVRCYELASEQCKTFKLSRMESVELIDLRWSYADRHKQMFTDVFMFSSENPQTVELSMGRLSSTLRRSW